MVNSLLIIYSFSLFYMLISPIISSLETAYRTALELSDTSKERDGVEVTLGSMSRYDFSLEECTESSLQGALQLTAYLTMQLLVTESLTEDDSDYHYKAIFQSCFFSTVSLTFGQVKANKINTENLTSFAK